MSKRLLVEYFPIRLTPEQLSESVKTNSGRIIVRGVCQRADAPNQNGRIYSRALLERIVAEYQKLIDERRALGELDHPESSVVELKNSSHNIVKLEWSGNDLISTIEILNTPSGLILQALIKDGITLGISSRGMGSVTSRGGTDHVDDDFQLICWDFVSDPSTHRAFQSLVSEGKNSTAVSGNWHNVNSLIMNVLNEW